MDLPDKPEPSASQNAETALVRIRDRFQDFLALLHCNNEVLRIIADMEEKAQGEYLFDINYVRSSLDRARTCVRDIAERLVTLGGAKYKPLLRKFVEIDVEIEGALPGKQPVERDGFTFMISDLSREKALSVGSKMAQLGEMKSKLGLPVPCGFAVTAYGYKHFIDTNDLQRRIDEMISTLDVKCYADLIQVSEEIAYLITQAPVPADLEAAIAKAFAALQERSSAERFAIRSSAIGEDSLYSFAGQYATYLNVPANDLLNRYRQVLASKFTPQAIYYFLSHSLAESELAMSVGFMEMVNAKISGVVYTRDPVRHNEDCLLINSIYGLGKYLVEGTINPDSFRISRQTKRIVDRSIACKARRLTLTDTGTTKVEQVPAEERNLPTIDEKIISELTDYALKLEEHYGAPQDIEWAIDASGKLFLLQTRPLRVVPMRRATVVVDTSGHELLLKGGNVICPGAAAGPIVHVNSTLDLCNVPSGAVVVAPHSFPGLITVMRQASAIVTAAGGVASHMATIAREYRIPTLGGLEKARELPEGVEVTVDATSGRVYYGWIEELITARREDEELFGDMPIFDLLKQILTRITPLNLIHPDDAGFTIEKCQSFHDIIRFAHQKAIEAMFNVATDVESTQRFGLQLKTDFPLGLNLLLIDEDPAGRSELPEEDVKSVPMRAFWSGVKEEGWPPARAAKMSQGGAPGVAVESPRKTERNYGQESFAVLSREYMIANLHLGYHYTTVEAMCTAAENSNFIRLQYKEGGASRDRRVRRVKLLTNILAQLGFEQSSESDFLSSTISDQSEEAIRYKLRLLGRLTMLTKQLDMALSNDAVTEWYTRDISRKLGLISTNKQGA